MLMDLFYDTLPMRITHKRRVHFHAFMLDVHKRMHAAKATGAGDPLLPVARDLADEAYVLCLDEFQVTDIADAMILRRLLDALLERGVVCVFTSKYVLQIRLRFAWKLTKDPLSSRHPDDLYKNGIQRTSFLPAIDLLKTQFDVTDLDSGTGPSFALSLPPILRLWCSRLSPRAPRTLTCILFATRQCHACSH